MPPLNATSADKLACESEDVACTVLVVLTTFQFSSTALTVMLKESPAIWPVGAPVLPLVVPGTGISPGISTWSFTKAPELTAMMGLLSGNLLPSVMSVAVTVWLPAMLNFTLNVTRPDSGSSGARCRPRAWLGISPSHGALIGLPISTTGKGST